MIGAARTLGIWIVVFGFGVELILGIIFSIFVLLDALKDFRAARGHEAEDLPLPTHEQARLLTRMFVKSEIARLLQMFLWLLIIVLSFTQPVADTVQDGWYILVTRVAFLIIGGSILYNSFIQYRTRRRLTTLQELRRHG